MGDSISIQVDQVKAFARENGAEVVTPNSGPADGGTSIVITGSNFQNGARVLIGGAECLNVVFVNAAQLTAVTPSESAGDKNMTLLNPDGQSVISINAFTYVPPPPQQTAVVSSIKAYPNPHRAIDGDIKIEVPTDSEIKIFDSAGQLVRELHGTGQVLWDMRNDNGNKVASGLYPCFIKGADGSKKKIPLVVVD